jgi:hypothetical protein
LKFSRGFLRWIVSAISKPQVSGKFKQPKQLEQCFPLTLHYFESKHFSPTSIISLPAFNHVPLDTQGNVKIFLV